MPSASGSQQRSLRHTLLGPQFGVAVTDAFVVAYAAFTLACQTTVLLGGKPAMLWRLATVVLGLVGLAGVWAATKGRATLAAHLDDGGRVDTAVPVATPWSTRTPLIVTAVALSGFLALRNAYWVWACGLGLAAFALGQGLRAGAAVGEPPAEERADPAWAALAVHASALVAGAIALFAVRPRSDDAFYTSMAHSLLRAPDLPLLGTSLVHGPPGALLGPQPMFAPYRVHSFELLGGYLAGVLGEDPTFVLHLGLATLIALLAPYAMARLLRQLAPSAWPLALLGAMLFYCVEGTASVGYANEAFVRSYHGKAALLTLGVPLILSYALRFGARPTRARFVWLALAQIAAVGMSSTALWLAPLLAVLGTAAAAPSARELLRRGVLAALTAAWVLALALWVFGQLRTTKSVHADDGADTDLPAAAAAQTAASRAPPPAETPLEGAVATMLGPERTAVVLLAVVPFALAALPLALPFRLFGLLGLALCALLTPPLAPYVGRFVTGVTTYHRVFWLLPIPLASGLAIAGMLERLRAAVSWPLAVALTLAATAAAYAIGVQRLLLSDENRVRFAFPPALEVGERAREVAVAACDFAPAGSYILASPSVSEQVAILPGCGYPVIAAARWMLAPRAERDRREQLARLLTVDGDIPLERAPWFLESLDHYAPRAVVMLQEALRNRRVKLLLRLAGYEKVAVAAQNHVFARRSVWQAKQDRKVAADSCAIIGKGSRVLAPFGVSTQIERQGHCRSALPVQAARARFDAQADELSQVERLIAIQSLLEDEDQARLRRVLADRTLQAVVVAPAAFGNSELKPILGQSGFHNAGSVSGYRLYARASAGASDP